MRECRRLGAALIQLAGFLDLAECDCRARSRNCGSPRHFKHEWSDELGKNFVVGEVGGPVIGVGHGGIESVVQLFHNEHQPAVGDRAVLLVEIARRIRAGGYRCTLLRLSRQRLVGAGID
jgi:hypothetical protein